jgi:hypothetical protein
MGVALRLQHPTYLSLAVLLIACQHTAPRGPYLPSHPKEEMFPRASSPPPGCPGQYRISMENYGGAFFMGCWGQKVD